MSDLKSTNASVLEMLKSYRKIVGVLAGEGSERKTLAGMGLMAMLRQMEELTVMMLSVDNKKELEEALAYFDEQLEQMEDVLILQENGSTSFGGTGAA
jgi:hypothetical protein